MHDEKIWNKCKVVDGFLMAPNNKHTSENAWKFSECTLHYFKRHIQYLDRLVALKDCEIFFFQIIQFRKLYADTGVL